MSQPSAVQSQPAASSDSAMPAPNPLEDPLEYTAPVRDPSGDPYPPVDPFSNPLDPQGASAADLGVGRDVGAKGAGVLSQAAPEVPQRKKKVRLSDTSSCHCLRQSQYPSAARAAISSPMCCCGTNRCTTHHSSWTSLNEDCTSPHQFELGPGRPCQVSAGGHLSPC